MKQSRCHPMLYVIVFFLASSWILFLLAFLPSRSTRNFSNGLSVLNNNLNKSLVLHFDNIIERTESIQLLRHQQKNLKHGELVTLAQQSLKTSDILHTVTYASHG